jgi:hypothetical protein
MLIDDTSYQALRHSALENATRLEAMGLEIVRGHNMIEFAASRRALRGYVHPALERFRS